MKMLPQQYCLRWRYHHSNLQNMFSQLLEREAYCDVTLACEGKVIKAHKIVLSACSTYFDQILSQYEEKDPILIIKDVKYVDIKGLIDFMYKGEINVEHCHLATLLKTAEDLKIKGLAEVSWKEEDCHPEAATGEGGGGSSSSNNGTKNSNSNSNSHSQQQSQSSSSFLQSYNNKRKRGRPPLDDYDSSSSMILTPPSKIQARIVKVATVVDEENAEEEEEDQEEEHGGARGGEDEEGRIINETELYGTEDMEDEEEEEQEQQVERRRLGGRSSNNNLGIRRISNNSTLKHFQDIQMEVHQGEHIRIKTEPLDEDEIITEEHLIDQEIEPLSHHNQNQQQHHQSTTTSINNRPNKIEEKFKIESALSLSHQQQDIKLSSSSSNINCKMQIQNQQQQTPNTSFNIQMIEKDWPDVVKMNDYLNTGRRQQFWEETFTKRVMDAIKHKSLEMKIAAELLGVSYGTLYGRYRDAYGCLKHPYR